MPALVVSTFGAAASLAFNPFTIPSNPCFARLYPSSRPKSIPLAFPSSNISSISLLKFCSKYFRPFSYPSSYARFHNKLRFSLSDVEVVAVRKILIVSMSASLMKSRNATLVGDGVLFGGDNSAVLFAVTVSTGGLALVRGDVDVANFALPCFFLLPGLMMCCDCRSELNMGSRSQKVILNQNGWR